MVEEIEKLARSDSVEDKQINVESEVKKSNENLDETNPPNTPEEEIAPKPQPEITPVKPKLSKVLSETPTILMIKKYLESVNPQDADENEDVGAGGDSTGTIKEKYSMRKLVYRKLIDFCHCWLREKSLFPKTYCLDSDETVKLEEHEKSDDDIFVKGFKLKNLESLQKILEEEKKLLDIIAGEPTFSTSVSESTEPEPTTELISTVPSTHIPPPIPMTYLMPEDYSYPSYELPFEIPEEEYEVPPSEEFWHPNSSVRKAQRYLRNHKIFQFFNYLCAMLVSACPGTYIKRTDSKQELTGQMLWKPKIHKNNITTIKTNIAYLNFFLQY